jgi:hypothetical protein
MHLTEEQKEWAEMIKTVLRMQPAGSIHPSTFNLTLKP